MDQNTHQVDREIVQMDRQIAQIRAEEKLAGDKQNANLGGSFMERIVRANITAHLLVRRDAALRAKKNYEDQLSRTYPTSIVGKVYVSRRPVAPKKTMIFALAVIPGFLIGVFAAFIINSFKAKSSVTK